MGREGKKEPEGVSDERGGGGKKKKGGEGLDSDFSITTHS